jgi:NAD(P)-dependent dehydrogenase (short-subunit alcohol dehydrogenase family)
MGQSHATTLAREGADIVMVDISENIGSVPYDLATAEQLEQTRAEVAALGGRVIAAHADVRRQEQLDSVVARAVEEFGGIDICIANAGIWSMAPYWRWASSNGRTWSTSTFQGRGAPPKPRLRA